MRIGFIDHHLNNFHANKFLSLLRGPLADEGGEVVLAWESDPAGDDWCVANGVARAGSAADVAKSVDAVIVLAPDNIEAHPFLASQALPAGRPTMIDKFLALSLDEARGIISAARSHGAPVFSSSSLRYAVELETALDSVGSEPVKELFARGMGSWPGYGVHTLAMAQRAMGRGVRRLIDTGSATARTVTLDYGGDRRAVLDVREASNQWEVFGWSTSIRRGDAYVTADVKDYDGFYANLMRHALEFFRTGRSDMLADEALETVAILESADRSRASGGEWVAVTL